jgi:hypothetical protein
MTRRASFNVVDSQFILLFFQLEITLNREKKMVVINAIFFFVFFPEHSQALKPGTISIKNNFK